MKKLTLMQAVLMALLTLVIGFFVGLYVEYPKTDTSDLAGTIGKTDRYRNVRVTEADIQLRNELLEDTAMKGQYDRYLTYYYYYAVRTSYDLEQVLKATASIPVSDGQVNASQEIQHYRAVLKKLETYLGTARVDILTALDVVASLDTSSKLPVISYLNDAQDAIARIRSFDGAILNYIDAIAKYMVDNPLLATQELKDAHDILVLNMTTAAVVVQDKATLRYLDRKKLMNDKDVVKELVAAEQFKATLNIVIPMDMERILGDHQLYDKERFDALLCCDFPIIVDQIVAGLTALLSGSGAVHQGGLQIYLDQQQLGFALLFDTQLLGVII